MTIHSSYLHCYVIYNDITNLVNEAKLQIEEDFIDFYDIAPENRENFILHTTEIKRTQKKYFYPFNLVIKTKSPWHTFFKKILEGLGKILEENPFENRDLVKEILLLCFIKIRIKFLRMKMICTI